MNSATTKILCQFNARVFCEFLSLPENFPRNLTTFSEEALDQLYKECKPKYIDTFLIGVLKTIQLLENLSLPLSVNIF